MRDRQTSTEREHSSIKAGHTRNTGSLAYEIRNENKLQLSMTGMYVIYASKLYTNYAVRAKRHGIVKFVACLTCTCTLATPPLPYFSLPPPSDRVLATVCSTQNRTGWLNKATLPLYSETRFVLLAVVTVFTPSCQVFICR